MFLFSTRFFYNWTFSPKRPGVFDFGLFIVKIGVVGSVLSLAIMATGVDPELALLLALVPLEEQSRFTWVNNSADPQTSALKFAAYISLFEMFSRPFSIGFADLKGYFAVAFAHGAAFLLHFGVAFLCYKSFAGSNGGGARYVIAFVAAIVIHFTYNLVGFYVL